MGKMYSGNIDVDYINNTVDIANHDGSAEGLKLGGTLVTATAAELNLLDGVTSTVAELNLVDNIAANVTIAYAASATTDGIEVTYTVVNAAGVAIAAVHALDVIVSDSATTGVLTSTAASGALTMVAGIQLEEVTAKKHIRILTGVNGIATVKLVDSANTAGEYFCCINPVSKKLVVGAATVATDYEGGV